MTEPPDSHSPSIEVADDQSSVPVDAGWIRALAERTLRALGIGGALSITLVEPGAMAELKERALGVREPTDVLAWPMDIVEPSPGPFVIGDVVLCPSVAADQARAAGKPFEDELALLLVHGILHCASRDHAEPDQERAMFAEQDELLAAVRA
ncbi:MAG: rRNA maturation RNase YbeY [Actinomycetota bacterium]